MEIDKELLSVLKMTQNIYFEYCTEADFEVKTYILKLIIDNHKALRHLKKIEFDYVKTTEDMKEIRFLNQMLVDLSFPILIGVKVMSTMIQTENLESVLKKAHKITKFFLTIEDQEQYRRHIHTISNSIDNFRYIEDLSIQL